MKGLSSFWFTLRALVRRSDVNAELDDELAFHLEQQTALYETQGMSPAAARREARLQFGGIERYREECRDVRRTGWIDDSRTDTRFAFRLMRLHPGFSINVILISALGIVACATTFSVVSGIILSPLPFTDSDRVFSLELKSVEGQSTAAVPVSVYQRIFAGSPVISSVSNSYPSGAIVEWNGEPERISSQAVTPSFFRVFGVAPILGRPFTDEETERREPVVLLGYQLWKDRFNGDSAVVGTQLQLDGAAYSILGVMPPLFRAHFSVEPDLWRPNRAAASDVKDGRDDVNPVLRLTDGATKESAEAWLRATMFLARSASRGGELNVRRALGASRGRQVRQLVTESLTLTAVGGVTGLLASVWAVDAIRGLGIRVLPRMDAVALDWRVLAFAIAGTTLTGVVGGLVPAISAWTSSNPTVTPTTDSRVTRHRISSGLVVAQIALAVVLLVGAGLLMKGFLRVSPTEPGFALEHRATIFVYARGRGAPADTSAAGVRQFADAVTERLARINGVREVALMSFLPFGGLGWTTEYQVPERPATGKAPTIYQNIVSPNFFSVMGIDVRQGRAFSSSDVEGGERVAIINETAATRMWPGENPLGRQLLMGRKDKFIATIVGVARDTRTIGTDTKIRPAIYYPLAQSEAGGLSFVVHTTGDPKSLAPEMKRAVWAVAPKLPIARTTDLGTLAYDSVRKARFYSMAMTVFAAVSVLLTALAVYGLLAFAVAERRREIGIRVALGATPSRVGALIVRRAVVLGVVGVVIGVVMARGLTRFMESLLMEVKATDGAVFAATAVSVLAVAVLAACAPAWQAVRVDPVKSLRS